MVMESREGEKNEELVEHQYKHLHQCVVELVKKHVESFKKKKAICFCKTSKSGKLSTSSLSDTAENSLKLLFSF